MKSLSIPFFTIRKIFFLRTEMDRLLVSSMLFSCSLVVVRTLHTGRMAFLFMVWNLFLAYIPYTLSTWLSTRYKREKTEAEGRQRREYPLLLLFLSLVWLLFIPNSFYILTDLYHLPGRGHSRIVPPWFDLVLILSFAWNGLLLGVLSVRQMERIFIPDASRTGGWFFVYPIMVLNALGVYTGRYLRYNSWDILSDPLQLLTDITGMIIHPFRNHYAWNMIFCFSILLTLIYRMLRRGSKAMA